MTDPQDAAEKYADQAWDSVKIGVIFNDVVHAFLAGAAWQREQDELRVQGLVEALDDIISRGTGTGGCVAVTTTTLRSIARQALAKWKGTKE